MAKFAIGDLVQCYCKAQDLFVVGEVLSVITDYASGVIALSVKYKVTNVAGELDEAELARVNIRQLERFLVLVSPTKSDVICPLPGCKKPNDAGVRVCWGCGSNL